MPSAITVRTHMRKLSTYHNQHSAYHVRKGIHARLRLGYTSLTCRSRRDDSTHTESPIQEITAIAQRMYIPCSSRSSYYAYQTYEARWLEQSWPLMILKIDHIAWSRLTPYAGLTSLSWASCSTQLPAEVCIEMPVYLCKSKPGETSHGL